MADFDIDQLDDDLGNICSPSYGGEAFKVSGVTYYGVFAQTDQQWSFELTGNRNDAGLTLTTNRTALTPTMNGLIYRPFDSTTYRITQIKPDAQAWDITLKKPTGS